MRDSFVILFQAEGGVSICLRVQTEERLRFQLLDVEFQRFQIKEITIYLVQEVFVGDVYGGFGFGFIEGNSIRKGEDQSFRQSWRAGLGRGRQGGGRLGRVKDVEVFRSVSVWYQRSESRQFFGKVVWQRLLFCIFLVLFF